MAKLINKLTELKIRNAKCTDKQQKLSDGKGMYLLLHPNQSKYWRMKYRFAGREKTLSMGVYPDVTLTDARILRDDAYRILKSGKDPSFLKRQKKNDTKSEQENTLIAIGKEWLLMKKPEWTPGHYEDVENSLNTHVFPYLGDRAINSLATNEIFEVLNKLALQEKFDLAHRVRQRLDSIYKYACRIEKCDRNPLINLQGVLPSPKKENYKALDKNELPIFIKKLVSYKGTLFTKYGFWLVLYTMARTKEIRFSVWEEFTLDDQNPLWIIPGSKMKNQKDHVIPLSKQALKLLKNLKNFSKGDPYLFHQQKNPKKPMSENTMIQALHSMGYKGEATVHGFRAMITTIFQEEQKSDVVRERLLSHKEKNKVRAAYNRYDYLDERREALQWWADYLDNIIKGN